MVCITSRSSARSGNRRRTSSRRSADFQVAAVSSDLVEGKAETAVDLAQRRFGRELALVGHDRQVDAEDQPAARRWR